MRLALTQAVKTPPPTRAKRARTQAFTLVEILLVLAIMGTLLSIAVPRLADIRLEGKYTAAMGDIRGIEAEILAYLAANRRLPADLSEVDRATLLDPWGRPYVYAPHYTGLPMRESDIVKKPQGARKDKFFKPLNHDFDLYCMGPDGKSKPSLTAEQSRDDVVRAVGGAFVGKAEDF